jgi:hypothetical protein
MKKHIIPSCIFALIVALGIFVALQPRLALLTFLAVVVGVSSYALYWYIYGAVNK